MTRKEKAQMVLDVFNRTHKTSREIADIVGVKIETVVSILKRNSLKPISSKDIIRLSKEKMICDMISSKTPFSIIARKTRSGVEKVLEILSRQVTSITDDFILWLFLDKNGEVNGHMLSRFEKHIKIPKTNLDSMIIKYLKNRYPDSSCMKETIHRIKGHIEIRPVCEYCGKPVKFVASGNVLFARFCNNSCSSKSESTINKRFETCKKLYDDPNFNNH